MPALALTEALLRTLRDYFVQAFPLELAAESEPVGALAANLVVGWEDVSRDILYPTITLNTPLPSERLGSAPQVIGQTPVDPGDPANASTVFDVHVGSVEQEIQVDVFARSRDERSLVVHAIEVALQQGAAASDSGLVRVSSPHYFGQEVTFRRGGGFGFVDTESAVGGDEWRATGLIYAEAHEIASVTDARLLDLSVDLRAGRPVYIGEGKTNEPSQLITIFQPAP